MSIYSMFLDKDKYYGKNMKFRKYTVNNLADIVKMYLDKTPDIDTIYIAGACYGRKPTNIEELVEKCFGTSKVYNIALIRKYRGYSYEPTKIAIGNKGHRYIHVNFDTGRSDHRKMMFFFSNNKVMAVLIGSSNYSPTTYLKNSSSEADLFLFNYKDKESKNVNKGIIDMLKNIFLSENHFSNNEWKKEENYEDIESNILFFKSLNDNNLLQEMFETIKTSNKRK